MRHKERLEYWMIDTQVSQVTFLSIENDFVINITTLTDSTLKDCIQIPESIFKKQLLNCLKSNLDFIKEIVFHDKL